MVRQTTPAVRRRQYALIVGTCVTLALIAGSKVRGAEQPPASAVPVFRQYCFQCHGGSLSTAGINLEKLAASSSVADNYQIWQRVIAALDSNRMPPKGMPSPSDEQRKQATTWIHSQLDAYVKTHAGDPGRVTVRRLTSGEYGYTIQDLTGLDLDLGIDSSSDAVGGEGFTNFGDVQFMQDANLERYLEAAKKVADHAVVGAGPLTFYTDPGKTGFEMSAINRIKDIYAKYGFRTVSGEGGTPFGLDKYGKALFVSWQYKNRVALGQPAATVASLAAKEGVNARFAQHISSVMNRQGLSYPASDMAAKFQKIPAPGADVKASLASARTQSDELQKSIISWFSWLFARGDAAVGGAGDESPLVINDKSLQAEGTHRFVFNRGGRGGRGAPAPTAGPQKVFLNIAAVNPTAKGKPVVIWRNPSIGFAAAGPGRGAATGAAAAGQTGGGQAAGQTGAVKPPAAQAAAVEPAANAAAGGGNGGGNAAGRRGAGGGPRVPLRTVVSEASAKELNFGVSPDGSKLGPEDFAVQGSVAIEVVVPPGSASFTFQADAEVGADRDQVFRITISDRDDSVGRGIPIRTILGDPKSQGFQAFKAGVLQMDELLPPNAFSEPTPADKDAIPEPFDSKFNVPEHDAFDNVVKYVRDDRFVYQNMVDDATRAKIDQAWNDVYASFSYQDNYLNLLAEHFKYDLHGKRMADLDKAQMDAMPAEMRPYVAPLKVAYDGMRAAEAAARPRHLNDCLEFASRAWRRPLTEKEKTTLRAFYDKALTEDPDHVRAIRTLLARILVAPQFLYRVEQSSQGVALLKPAAAVTPPVAKTLGNFELASRLSYFLWASIPDDELRRAAATGELSTAAGLQKQTKRMLADPKSRRLSTEFFGQWLGFYQFDQYKGVDTTRYPEFTPEVKSAMYDEAVSFFSYIIQNDRPVKELFSADYMFLNRTLAKYYGIKKEVKSKDDVELVQGAHEFNRGGLLRLGAILTTTSAPLRTSPVRRGDWVLRRIIGTPVPPPPADAGSIPADDKLFGGMSVKERLQVHKRNATCAGCHTRIDPLGFPLEHFDSTGRWRDQYSDGKVIEDFSTTNDNTEIKGIDGLIEYLHKQDSQVQKTLAKKLIGYALGRTLQLSDQPLVDGIAAAGGDAGFSRLINEIVVSKQFRNRAGQEDSAAPAPMHRASAAPQGRLATTTIPEKGKAGER